MTAEHHGPPHVAALTRKDREDIERMATNDGWRAAVRAWTDAIADFRKTGRSQ